MRCNRVTRQQARHGVTENMRSIFSVLVLVAVADALPLQLHDHASVKNIQRLPRDEPIPEGWRLATVEDAQRNAECFRLVLRPRAWRRKRDKAALSGEYTVAAPGNPFAGSPLCIEKSKLPPEQCTSKVVVRFNEGEVVKRERYEHVVSRVCKLCEYYILIYSMVSISPSFAFRGLFFDVFLFVTYIYSSHAIRSEWIRRRGSI